MLKTEDFSSVFALRQRSFIGQLCIYSNNNQLPYPRVGLVVSKKCAKKAHDRNTMKRCLREWFRLNKFRLPEKDFVIQVRQKFDKKDFVILEKQLQRLWVKP